MYNSKLLVQLVYIFAPIVCVLASTQLSPLQVGGMSERGSSKHESPRRSSGKKGDKNGSKEHSSKVLVEKEASTKVLHVRTAQPVASTSQQAPATIVCEPLLVTSCIS